MNLWCVLYLDFLEFAMEFVCVSVALDAFYSVSFSYNVCELFCQMSVTADSPAHSSSSDDFAAFLDGELDTVSEASSELEAEVEEEDWKDDDDDDEQDGDENEGQGEDDGSKVNLDTTSIR